MKGTRWALLIILILAFICAGNFTTWPGEQPQVKVKLIRILTGHTGYVSSMAFSPDGQSLASGSSKGAIKLWEVDTGREVYTLWHAGQVGSVVFRPDGQLLASCSDDFTIKLWEVITDKKVRTISGHTAPVSSVSFSPDGRLLASGSGDNTVRLWEVSNGQLVRTLSDHTGWPYSVTFSPDGQLLASGSFDRTIKLWETNTGQEICTLSGHRDYVSSIAFSPDGRLLASGSGDGMIKLWEVSTGREVRTLQDHTGSVGSVTFSPDGRILASAGYNTIKLWDVTTGQEIHTLTGHAFAVNSVAFSPDGKLLASGSSDKTIKLWEVQVKEENKSPQARFTFSPAQPAVGQAVRFDASDSSDPDGTITSYHWDFGDGSTGSGKITTHTYDRKGTFTVTLTVTDDDGTTDSTSKTITVIEANKAPKADFTFLPREPTDLDTIEFTDRSTDPDGRIVKWHWDFGDGETSTEQNPQHRYRDDGTYMVKLTVTDDDGATDTASQEITVLNVPPKAAFTFSPQKPLVNVPVTFDASGSSDPDGQIERYEWNCGDGSIGGGRVVTHTFTAEGRYRVKLTVTDDDGATDSIGKEVAVIPPEVEIKDRYAIVIGIFDYLYATEETCPGFCDLKYPVVDALAFYRLLIDENVGNFPEDHVALLLDEQGVTQAIEGGIVPEGRVSLATSQDIRSAFGNLIIQAEEDDLVVIYYSGHGAQGPDIAGDQEEDGRDEYYIAYDTKHTDLFGTGISDDDFGNWMDNILSRHVIIFLDSCFSGGATREIKSMSSPDVKAIPNNSVFNDFSLEERVLIAASQENEVSYESAELGHGVFTHYLLEALDGKADLNKDGQIEADEVYEYVKPRVKEYVAEHYGDSQTPLRRGTISPVVVPRGEALEGEITAIAGNKEQALLGDGVYINLGSEDGVKVGDIFEVYHELKPQKVAVQPAEEVRGKIKVIEVLEEHRSLCEVIESKFPIEVGDKVRKVEKG